MFLENQKKRNLRKDISNQKLIYGLKKKILRVTFLYTFFGVLDTCCGPFVCAYFAIALQLTNSCVLWFIILNDNVRSSTGNDKESLGAFVYDLAEGSSNKSFCK